MTEADTSAAARRLQEAVRRLAEQSRGRTRTGTSHEDADDLVGTVLTDDALGFDPFPLLCALDDHGARIVVMGQVAGIMHGSRELTGDLDLLWDGNHSQAQALAGAFAASGALLADQDGAPVRCEPSAFSLPKLSFRSAMASGDCCTPALSWGDLPVTDFLARSQVATMPSGFKIWYLTCPDLITMRRAVGRTKDLRRADELEQLARACR